MSKPAPKRDRQDRSPSSASSSLPAAADAQGAALSAPLDQLARAMQAQAEVLKKIHDGQQRVVKAVDDERRAELMINSTRSLNDSFQGMRRVQEKLLDRLGAEGSGSRRWLLTGLVAGALLICGALVWGVLELRGTVEKTGADLSQPRSDPAVQALVGSLEEFKQRLATVETEDRNRWSSELERLQHSVLDMGTRLQRAEKERDALKEERDTLLERVGAATADRERDVEDRKRLEKELETARQREKEARDEASRLTKKALENQRLIVGLNQALEKARPGVKVPTEAGTSNPGAIPVPAGSGGTVASAGKEGGETELPVAGTGEAGNPASPESAAAPAAGEVQVTPELLGKYNELLQNHRGSDRYSLVRLERIEDDVLRGVTLMVRGKDGSKAKTVDADTLTFKVTPRGELLDLDFSGGHVTFHRGGARDIRSPFYGNRYQIVVLGIDVDAWKTAALPATTIAKTLP